MKKLWIVLFTVVLGATLTFAQTKKATDQKAATTKAAPAATTKTPAKPATENAAAAMIDVNSASQADLEKLPGIGPVIGKRIVDGRPYKTKRDLLTKKIVGQAEYDKIKDTIIAHQDKSAGMDKKK